MGREMSTGGSGNKDDLGWIRYMVVGTELAFSVLAGLFLGYMIDKWLVTTAPWFTLLGVILGMAAGFGMLFRILKKSYESNDNGKDGDT